MLYKTNDVQRVQPVLTAIMQGGTWAENVYPGVRCDVPSHAYQLTFEPNPHWTEVYAPGTEIQEYYESVVGKYDVASHLKRGHQVLQAI
jgi:cation diffusion facilitator CzcD-associated flavoprotein CzcO